MDASIFLARLLGPVLVVFSIFILFQPERLRRAGQQILDSEALMLVSGAITLPAGLAIVIAHPAWSADWRGAITLFGWIMVVAGTLRLLFPARLKPVGDALLKRRAFTAAPGALMALLGLWFSWHGWVG